MRRRRLTWLAVVAAALVAFGACKKKEGRAKRSDTASDTAPGAASGEALGPVRDEVAMVRLAVYFLPTPRTPPRAELDKLVATEHTTEPGLTIVTDLSGKPPLPVVIYGEPPIAEYAPPDAESLQYFTRGLSDTEASAFLASKQVAVIGFLAKSSDALAQLRRAHRVATALATATGGLVWSDDMRLAFGAAAWAERGHALDGDTPDVERLFTIHAYQAGPNTGVRLVSLGLGQLGLPELVIEDATRAEGERAIYTINLVAQLLAEGAQPGPDGRLALSVDAVKNEPARARLKAAIVEKGTGKAEVRFVIGKRDQGDDDNRLWRIDFLGDGPYNERLSTTVAALFGRVDGVYNAATGDAELAAASAKAKAELAALRPTFQKGLPDREHLLVKAPFATDSGGTEYMWLEVRTWKGARIEGILTDEPFEIAKLHAGAPVDVAEADVFDYILRHADGTLTGNHTTPILEKRDTTRP